MRISLELFSEIISQQSEFNGKLWISKTFRKEIKLRINTLLYAIMASCNSVLMCIGSHGNK